MIRAKFDMNALRKIFDQVRKEADAGVVSRLVSILKETVDDARTRGDYKNQTKRLRSSIGGVVLFNGQVVEEYFPGDQQEGVEKGSDFANQLAIQYPTGYAIIIVAAMHYAGLVEVKGYDVLTMSAMLAEQELKTQFQTGFVIR